MQKYFGASYELKPTRVIFSQCAQKKVNEIFKGQIMIKANILPVFNTDMTILLKLCLFLWFFDVFRSKNPCYQKNQLSGKGLLIDDFKMSYV